MLNLISNCRTVYVKSIIFSNQNKQFSWYLLDILSKVMCKWKKWFYYCVYIQLGNYILILPKIFIITYNLYVVIISRGKCIFKDIENIGLFLFFTYNFTFKSFFFCLINSCSSISSLHLPFDKTLFSDIFLSHFMDHFPYIDFCFFFLHWNNMLFHG